MAVSTSQHSISFPVVSTNFLFKYLRNGSNSAEMAVDGSSTAVDFSYTAATTRGVVIHRLNIVIADNSINPGDFGGIASGLTTSIQVLVLDSDNSTIFDFTDSENISTNSEFGFLAGVDVDRDTQGAGDDVLVVRWTLAKAGQELRLLNTHKIAIRVNDNLTALTSFKCMVQGYKL